MEYTDHTEHTPAVQYLDDAEAIFNVDDVQYADVPVPEWKDGAVVRVRSLTSAQRSRIEGQLAEISQSKRGYDRLGHTTLQVVVWCVVKPNGERVFSDAQVKRLGDRNSAPMLRIRDKVYELSGMGPDAAEKAEEVFDEAPSGDSFSD